MGSPGVERTGARHAAMRVRWEISNTLGDIKYAIYHMIAGEAIQIISESHCSAFAREACQGPYDRYHLINICYLIS